MSRWKKELQEQSERAVPGHGQPHDEELAQLSREVEVLRQEREVSKKHLRFSRNTEPETAFIHQHQGQFAVGMICRVLG